MRGTIWLTTRLRYLSFNARVSVSTPSHCPAMWKMNPSRRCSPSVTKSRPSFSWCRSTRMVASSHASCMFSGGTTKAARVTFVFASHRGLGKLPMLVVARGPNCMSVSVPWPFFLTRIWPCNRLPDQLFDRGDDLVDPGKKVLLERRAERHRHGGEVEPFRRLLEQAEAPVGEDACHLRC